MTWTLTSLARLSARGGWGGRFGGEKRGRSVGQQSAVTRLRTAGHDMA
jgi:hypothetical protein